MKCYKYSLNSQILSKRAMGQLNWGYNSEFTLTPKCLQFSDPKSPKRSLPNQRVTWEYDDSPVDLAGFTMVFHQFFRQSHISYDHKVWDQMLLYFPIWFPYVSHIFLYFPCVFPCSQQFSLIHEASPGGTCASAPRHPRRRRSSPWTPQWEITDSIVKIGSHRT